LNLKVKYKIIVCGNASVGKTSLILRYTQDKFTKTKSTIGVDFAIKDLYTTSGDKVRLQLWDFAGEERFRTLLPKFCMGATGCLLLYDLTNSESFFSLNEWMDIIRSNTGRERTDGTTQEIPIVFIGAKKDLLNGKDRKINLNYVDEFIDNYDLNEYIEISSKTGENVEKAFQLLAGDMLELYEGNTR
jgi:small GTP-binding protein